MKRKLSVLFGAGLVLSLLFGCVSASAAGTRLEDAATLVMDIPTTQYFTMEAIPQADVERIVQAGVNAPSAMNTQPWHFSVVTDASVLAEIASGMSFGGGTPPAMGEGGPQGPGSMPGPGGGMPQPPEGGFDAGSMPAAPSFSAGGSKAGLTDAPLAIIVSCEKGSELSAGLAVQTMSVEAQLLGYGSKIISSPTIALNGARSAEFAELLGIPEGQSAVAVLLVGCEDTGVDTTADAYTGATSRSPLSEKVSYIAG